MKNRSVWLRLTLIASCLTAAPAVVQAGTLEQALQESHTFYRQLVAGSPFDLVCLISAGLLVICVCGCFIARLWRPLNDRQARDLAPWRLVDFVILVHLYLIWDLTVLAMLGPGLSISGSFLAYWLINGLFCAGLVAWLRVQHHSFVRGQAVFDLTWHQIKLGLVSYLLFFAWYWGSYCLTQLVYAWQELAPHAQRLAEEVLILRGWPLGLALVTTILGAPLFEELLFRCWLYGSFRKLAPPILAIPVSALVFALAHLENGNYFVLFPIFTLGCFLALLYERSRSLWASVAAHSLHNAVTILYLYFVVA